MLLIKLWFVVSALVLEATNAADVPASPKFLYDIYVDVEPAFCSILKNTDATQTPGSDYDLAFSSFTGNVFKKDTVLSIDGINDFLLQSSFNASVLTDTLQWPNEVSQVPDGIFDSRVWTVASGFFLAGKDNGTVGLLDMTNSLGPFLIPPKEEKLWFYHRVVWEDMNKDGHLDAVTARAYGSGDQATESQLVWFENPGVKEVTGSWNLHVVHEGSEDIAFRIHDMNLPDGSTTPVIISAGFWSKELGLTWSSTNNWLDSSSIQHMSVDNYGWYFDLEVVDVNSDGFLDILCTTWSQLGDPGALLVYEIPNDWQNGQWTRHILQDGYKSFPLPGKGSPGSAIAFWPITGMQESGLKPYILVSGDDAGDFFVLTSDSDDPTDWSYTSTTIYHQSKGTVGAMAVGDVDGDGTAEVFLPAYAQKFIRVMSYGPY